MAAEVNWINVGIDIASVLIAFVMLYLKIIKESRENKHKRYKLKDRLNKVDTEIVPSFNNLSNSVIDLTTTIRDNSVSISEEVCNQTMTRNRRLNRYTKDQSSSTSVNLPKKSDHVEIELEDFISQSDLSLGGVQTEKAQVQQSSTDMIFVVYEDVVDVIVLDSSISGYEFATGAISMNKYTNKYIDMKQHKINDTIRTILSYEPIEAYQIDRSNLNLMFNSVHVKK